MGSGQLHQICSVECSLKKFTHFDPNFFGSSYGCKQPELCDAQAWFNRILSGLELALWKLLRLDVGLA